MTLQDARLPSARTAPPAGRRMGGAVLWRTALSEYAVLFIAAVYFAVAWSLIPDLTSRGNLSNLLSNMLPLLVLAIGQTVVLITAGIDLSMVAVVGACSVLGALVMTETPHLGLMPAGHPWAVPAGIAAMLVAGAAIGLLNGLAVGWLRMPPFIATLAMMMVLGGASVWGVQELKVAAAERAAAAAAAAGNRPRPVTLDPSIGELPESFAAIAFEDLLGLPYALWVAGGLAIAVHLLLRHTLLGRRLYAVGLNPSAAVVSGARVRATVVSAYVISGFCAALAAVLYTARLETGKPELLGRDALLDVVGAAVIGGTSLFGGKGKVVWTILGVLLFTLISYTLNLLNLQDDRIMVAKGSVILVAAMLDVLRKRLAG